MARRTNLKLMTDRIRRFEEDERSEVNKAIAYRREGWSDEQLAVMTLLQEGQTFKRYGLLALMYNCCSRLSHDLTEEELRSERYFSLRWAGYLEALKEWASPDSPSMGIEKHHEREAILVLSMNTDERGEDYSDFFNARMMLEDYGEKIKFCAPWKKWLIWDGKRWAVDELGEIYELGRNSIEALFAKLIRCRDGEECMAMLSHARRSSTARKVESMLFIVKSDPRARISPDALDQDVFHLNCNNGIIDLRSGRLHPHRREDLLTKLAPVDYLEEADCPVWKKFLKEIFDGNRELIRFVQKFLGCSLTGDMSSQVLCILYGTGANGKSTFINVVNRILGDYATTTPTETLMQKKGEQATNDIARLKGSRFVTAMESDEHGRLAESVIKRLTGNDMISARFLYGEYFQFIPTFKIVMATNHKPRIGGTDHAIWRRIKLIPFLVTFPEEKQDKKLSAKLERELPGILAWMVEGCLRWQKEGLGSVEAVNDATDEYRSQMSDIQMFLSENCEMKAESMTQSSVLYREYRSWCEKNNERAKSNRNFSMMLSESGMDKVRLSAGIFWIGIKLVENRSY
ncbi:phage/plasmid primase, P4 family [Oceanispirochaeta sp.]|jgi:putative DNA primase/helicase|uniref:DNA primase family protein n=1 Tax=Oceanispirochaeta sp. TaxID=2035350 RepID=UPI00261EE94B|nr:phage/plasmid primase, P4 family [Oceanispirochaeta sp.]MDA3956961.1 phage/plasmid primase, P4 family [Oceanispirochaeta sp.]